MFIVYYAALQLHNDYDRTTAHDGGTRHVYIQSPLRTCTQYVRLTGSDRPICGRSYEPGQ